MIEKELAEFFLAASLEAGYSVSAIPAVNERLEQEGPGLIYLGKVFFFDLLVQFRLRHIAIATRYPSRGTWQDLQTLEYSNPDTIPMLVKAIEGYPKHLYKPVRKLRI